MSEEALSLERFRTLVDAYGGRPEHWPAAERGAALTLLARSADARRLRMAAMDLDDVLDLATPIPPSAELAAHILSAVPAALARPPRRRLGSRHALAASTLIAAAALAGWVVLLPVQPPEVQIAIEDLGQYDTPTDVLLDTPSLDLANTLPSLGCEDEGLGCIEDATVDETESRNHESGRTVA